MRKKIGYFLIAILAGALLWRGGIILKEHSEQFFYWLEMGNNSGLLAAQAAQTAFQNHVIDSRPFLKKSAAEPDISAKSVISLLIDGRGNERILFEKNKDEVLPIASLAKLMTAKVVFGNYDLSKEIVVSKEAVEQEEDFGKLTAGKKLSVEYLLYPLLMESSNDAAYALADDYEGMSEKDFVKIMNEFAQKTGMESTGFFNPTGLEPDVPNPEINYSTAHDLSKLVKSLLEEPLLWEILATSKFNVYGPELVNTNELLGKLPGIVGGKTGYAEKAGGCLILVTKAERGKGYVINIILGSYDRFGEMEKLVNWLNAAYIW